MTRVHVMHCSMQYSDTDAQKRSDISDIFERAEDRGVSWITGTEAGEKVLADIIKNHATKYGFSMHRWRDNWICVRNAVVTPHTWKTGSVFVAKASETVGPGHDSGFPWVTWEFPKLGVVSLAAGHYPTKGAEKGDPNHKIVLRYAKAVGDWAREKGAGKQLAFYQGDQNVTDREHDTFYGQPLTSAWDELGKYENTGHGNIDVIASYDADGRVKTVYIRALDDTEFAQYSDHFVVEAGFEIQPLNTKKVTK